jgi:hypothetical protein
MEEDQERDSPSDEEREIIEDEDMEDSATDISELWIPDRNDEDTKFVRGQGHPIPTKKSHNLEKKMGHDKRSSLTAHQ